MSGYLGTPSASRWSQHTLLLLSTVKQPIRCSDLDGSLGPSVQDEVLAAERALAAHALRTVSARMDSAPGRRV